MNKICDYRITASMLNSFNYYLNNELSSEKEMLDIINRVPQITTEAQAKGICFEYLINNLLFNNNVDLLLNNNTNIEFCKNDIRYNFNFEKDIILKILSQLKNNQSYGQQVYVSKIIQLEGHNIELYGYIDYITPNSIIDLKTTANYSYPKYLNNFQLLVYGEILLDKINSVDFLITDFKEIYREIYNIEHIKYYRFKLEKMLLHFIEFLEKNKLQITDKKIFGFEVETNRENNYKININL